LALKLEESYQKKEGITKKEGFEFGHKRRFLRSQTFPKEGRPPNNWKEPDLLVDMVYSL